MSRSSILSPLVRRAANPAGRGGPAQLSRRAVAAVWLTLLVGCGPRGDIVLGTGAQAWPDDTTATQSSQRDAVVADQVSPAIVTAIAGAASQAAPTPAIAAGIPAGTVVPSPSAEPDADAGSLERVGRPSAGCAKDPTSVPVFVNGARASFMLDVPKQYNKHRGYPLLLALRGSNQTSEEFRSELNLTSIADAIVVYANPLDPYLGWQFQRDVAQVDALLEKLGDAYCVDQDRVFALGNESGSMMANWLGCVRGDRMRAVATLTSAPPPPETCIGSAAVWLLQRIDSDPMTVGTGYGNRDFWASRNGCDMSMPHAVAGTSCVEYADCVPDTPVRFCEYSGAASPSFAASAAWQFFNGL